MDVLLAGFGFEFFAELSYEDAEILGLMGGLSSPDGGEQGAMGHDLAGMAGEVKEQIEFLGGEVEGLAVDGDAMGGFIDHEVAGLDGGGGSLGSAAEMGADAGEQLLNAEGLGT